MTRVIKNVPPAIILAILLGRCGVGPIATSGGGASETIAVVVTDSTVSGKVTVANGNGDSPVPGATVKLFERQYLPYYPPATDNFYDSAVSDETGDFRFPNIRLGSYGLYVRAPATDKSAFIDSIYVRKGCRDTLHDSLSAPGAISGHVCSIAGGDTAVARKYHVFILGTQFKCKTDSTGSFLLNGLPEGCYALMSAPEWILKPADSMATDKKALQYILSSNKGAVLDTIKSGKTIAGKTIYLTP